MPQYYRHFQPGATWRQASSRPVKVATCRSEPRHDETERERDFQTLAAWLRTYSSGWKPLWHGGFDCAPCISRAVTAGSAT